MDFLIVYERKNREYENAVLLQLELERRGYQCEIAQFYDYKKFNILSVDPPKVILVPHLYITRSVCRTIYRFGRPLQLVNLQYEQVLSKREEEYGLHNPSGEAKKGIHICWGKNTEKRLKDAGVLEKNIHTLGALQLDMLRPEFRNKNFIRRKYSERYDLPLDKKWALFLSSFTFADISSTRLEINENVVGTELQGLVDIHTKHRDTLLQWFERVLQAMPDKILIYRPHQDEFYLDKINALAARYSNFRVIGESAVKTWIEASDESYSWYSTSVVEAHRLESPYAILRPYELSERFDCVLLKDANFITTSDDFYNTYRNGLDKNSFAISNEDIDDYYQVFPGTTSFTLYCDLLEQVYQQGEQADFDIPFREKVRAIAISSVIKVSCVLGEWYKKVFSKKEIKLPVEYVQLLLEEIAAQSCSQKEYDEIRSYLQKKISNAKSSSDSERMAE